MKFVKSEYRNDIYNELKTLAEETVNDLDLHDIKINVVIVDAYERHLQNDPRVNVHGNTYTLRTLKDKSLVLRHTNENDTYLILLNSSLSIERFRTVVRHELRHVWQGKQGYFKTWNVPKLERDAEQYSDKFDIKEDLIKQAFSIELSQRVEIPESQLNPMFKVCLNPTLYGRPTIQHNNPILKLIDS